MPTQTRTRRTDRSYRLTPDIVSASVGAGVLALAPCAFGRTYRLHTRRPDATTNRIAFRGEIGLQWVRAEQTILEADTGPRLVRVDIEGPLEARAGYHGFCGGWSDGHDAVADRLIAAFAEGDVFLVVDSPGGACAQIEQQIARAQKEKARLGRRVIIWADEMIASAAVWWAFGVGDEIYIPKAGQVGSIGARGGHESIAELLAKEGRAVTYFTWPDEGKIAFAPELPLSDLGRARGDRDVAIAGEAFAATIVESSMGRRRGLTRDLLVAQKADLYTGQAAVDAGLADGISTFEEAIEYALALAETPKTTEARTARIRTEKSNMPRSEEMPNPEAPYDPEPEMEEEKDDPEAQEEPMPESETVPGAQICGVCGAVNTADAKYCSQCGAALGEPEMPEAQDDEDPEKDKPDMPEAKASGSLATILGLPENASLPAQKTAAMRLRSLRDHAASLTGEKSTDAIKGALTAMATEAGETAKLRGQLREQRTSADKAERWRLCSKLATLNVAGHETGKIFIAVANTDGTPKKDAAGNPIRRIAPMYAEMKLATLRGLVGGFQKTAHTKENPWNPNEEAARKASTDGAGTAANADEHRRIQAAMKNPAVIALAKKNGHKLEEAAAEWVRAGG